MINSFCGVVLGLRTTVRDNFFAGGGYKPLPAKTLLLKVYKFKIIKI